MNMKFKFLKDKLKEKLNFKFNLNNDFKKVFLFHWHQIINSKTFIISFVLVNLLPLLILLPLVLATDFYSLSYLYSLIIVFASVFFNFFFIYKLFIVNSSNFIDILIISKSINKKQVFLVRIFYIFISLLISSFIQSIISVIIVAPSTWSALTLNIWLMTFFGQIIIGSFFISIFLSIGVKLSSILFVSLNSCITLLFLITSILGNALLVNPIQNNSLTYDVKNNYNYQVVSNINNSNDKRIGITRNWTSQINTNSDLKNSINFSYSTIQVMPGLWIMSPMQLIFANNNVYGNDYNFLINHSPNNYQFSMNKLILIDDQNNTDYFKVSSKYTTYRVGDTNLFELTNHELEQEISQVVKNVYDDFLIQNKDINVLSLLNNELNSNDLWNLSQTINDNKSLLLALLGLDVKYSSLYYLFRDFDYFYQNIPYLFDSISSYTNNEFSQITKSLWTLTQTKNNLYNLNYFGNYENIEQIYPNLLSENGLEKPNNSDVEFFKNYLIKFDSQNNCKVLNKNGEYIDFDIKNLDNAISNQNDWNIFVETNSLNLNSLKKLYLDIRNNTNSLYGVSFTKNYQQLDKFYSLLKVEQVSWFDMSWLITTLFILIPIITIPFTGKSFIKKNIK
ncbi:MAG: hypothetical protein K2H56_01720 [Malacoplasma sp.]|nr:hypothetical protein [Malacoplasma sp.]